MVEFYLGNQKNSKNTITKISFYHFDGGLMYYSIFFLI